MTHSTQQSELLFKKAQQYIPGGVNSPVRAFRSVGGTPIFMKSAKGAYLLDVDGNQYVDFVSSWGPLILGHCHPEVVKAVQKKISETISFGAPTELETEMAGLITGMVSNVDQIRLVNSGTEACMSAIRLARGYTGRNRIIKFEGCYHGHADSFLVKAGSGVATFGIQHVPGVTAGVSQDTLIAPYNDLQAVKELIKAYPGEIAALIIEPVAGNMGCVLPESGFLEGLRELCTQNGIVYIFDEVMTGFRLALGGAQERLKIEADLVTYGKVIGGGLPVGAFGGKREIMQHISPMGNVYQAGTLSGNPVTVTAGYTTLNILKNNPGIYQDLENIGNQLSEGIRQALNAKGIPHTLNHIGSMLSLFFGDREIKDFETVSQCDVALFNRFFHHMLKQGFYLPPSAYETWFLNASISQEDLEKTIHAVHQF